MVTVKEHEKTGIFFPNLCHGQYRDNGWADVEIFSIGDRAESRTFFDRPFGVDVTGSMEEAEDSSVSDTWVVKLEGVAW